MNPLCGWWNFDLRQDRQTLLGAQSDVLSHFHPDVVNKLFTSTNKQEFLDWALKNFDTYFDRVVTV